MMVRKIVLGVLIGAIVGVGLNRLLSPVLGGACRILCVPYRAVLAGAVLGGLVAFGLAREAPSLPARNEPDDSAS